jgi:hypothetical protein
MCSVNDEGQDKGRDSAPQEGQEEATNDEASRDDASRDDRSVEDGSFDGTGDGNSGYPDDPWVEEEDESNEDFIPPHVAWAISRAVEVVAEEIEEIWAPTFSDLPTILTVDELDEVLAEENEFWSTYDPWNAPGWND